MISDVLKKARKYEEERERMITPEKRPAFHLASRVGWMNDPNGFSFYNGQYHLFYQYHPYRSVWGPMHWGHAVSDDLIRWQYLPAAMGPDEEYDKDGCFSGTAAVLPDGRALIMYTSVRNTEENGRIRGIQTQSIAVGDGREYVKYDHNPVISKENMPDDADIYDFRDPKLWQETDGTYRCIIANRSTRNKSGRILRYKSEDGFHWEYEGVMIDNDDRIGLMWECPDFFTLDGRDVIISSAMDMQPEGLKYYNGNGTFYMIGTYDKKTGKFTEECDHAVDCGIDFYAPQTIAAPDGRRIMVAWMQNWDTCNLHTPEVPWFGQMCTPRELSIKDGRLYQNPVRELLQYRKHRVTHKDISFADGVMSLPGVEGRTIDLTVDVAPQGDELYRKFALRFAEEGKMHTAVSFRPYEGIIKIDRKFSGSRRAIIHQKRAAVGDKDGRIRIRLLLDRFSAEVFVDDGRKAMSVTIDTPVSAKGVSFFADGMARISADKYDIAIPQE